MPDGNSTYEDLLNLTDFKMPSAPQLQNLEAPGINGGSKVNVDPADIFQQFQNKINGINDRPSPSSVLPTSPSQIDTSGRYPLQRIGENNEELYSQGQSVGSKFVNGLGKGLALTGTTFLQSTVGFINGVGNFTQTGKLSSFYDNSFNRGLDEINKNLENQLPNYYSQAEKDANWYTPTYLLSANFLFDGILKNLGFSAGALLAGGVYASALKAIPLTAKLFAVGKGAEALAASEEAIAGGKAAETFGRIKGLSDKFLGSYSAMNPAGRAVVAGLGTIGESSFEALSNLNEFRSKKIAEYTDAHGTAPIEEDLDAINKSAEDVGNVSLGLNTVLLTATQYIQLPKIMGSSYTGEKRIIDEVVSKTKGIVKNSAGEFVQQAPRFGKILSTLNKIRPYTFSASEAFEEGAQYAIQIGTQDYYNKKYRKQDADILSSVEQGIGETLSTNEGQKNILLGGLSGALMMGRERFKEDRQISRNTANAISSFNKTQLSAFTNQTFDTVKRAVAIQEDRENAIAQGDVLESKDLEKDYMINYLSPRIQYDRYDLVKEDVNTYKQLGASAEGLEQLKAEGKALDTDTSATFLERVNALERTADNMHSLYQSLNLRYKGVIDQKGERVYNDDILNKMVYTATKITDYDERIPQLISALGISVSNTSNILEEARQNKNELFNKAIEEIDSLKIIEDKKEELKTNLADARELTARRDLFLEEYSALKSAPSKFQDVEQIAVTPPEQKKEKITIKTQDGEQEYETGVDYYLGNVVEHDKSRKEIYRFPILTILGKNEDGTIKIKDKNGIRDIEASVLTNYKLGKVSAVKGNKKASFYKENINTIYEYKQKAPKAPLRGRLSYDNINNTLYFVYKDAKGKIKSIEVVGQDFKAKKGFKEGLLTPVGNLTVAQQEVHKEFSNTTEDVIKRQTRLKILEGLIDETGTRLSKLNAKLEINKSQLTSIDNELDLMTKRIEGSKLNRDNFTKATKAAIRNATRLSNLKNTLETENEALQADRDDLEFNLEYFYDIAQNIDEVGLDAKEVRDEIKSQVDDLESLQLELGNSINTISSLINKVEGALDTSLKFLRELLSKFTSSYRGDTLNTSDVDFVNYANNNPEFLKNKTNFKEDLAKLNDSLDQVESLDVLPNERTIKELRDALEPIQAELKEVQKQITVKQAILDKFDNYVQKEKTEQEAREKFERNKKLHNELFQSQSSLQGDSGSVNTGSPATVIAKEDSSRKLVRHIASSTDSSPATDPKGTPERARNWAFLSNYDNMPNKANIKIITVTKNNETALGLEGLAAYKMGANVNDVSADNGFVAFVYVHDENGKRWIVDVDGNKLAPLGEKQDINKIVYAVASSTAKTNSKGKERYAAKEGDKGSVDDYTTAWKNTRAKWLAQTDEYSIYDFDVSRGIGIEPKVDGKAESNPIVGTLITEEDVATKGIITISTTGTISHNDESINFPVGRPVITKGSTVQFVNNRNFTPKEVNTLFDVIKQLATLSSVTGKLDGRLISYLQGMVHWITPTDINKVGRNQMWIANGKLHMGKNDVVVDFFTEEIAANEEKIKTFLTGAYNNINNKKLNDKFNEPYEEILSVENGNIKSIQWKSYQSFLLSNKYDLTEEDKSTLNGVNRPKESLPLTTSIRKKVDKNDYNYENKYIILQNNELDVQDTRPKKVEKPVEKKEEKESLKQNPIISVPTTNTNIQDAPISSAGIVFDGKTINSYKTKSGYNISYTAIVVDGKVQVQLKEDKQYALAAATLAQNDSVPGSSLRRNLGPKLAGFNPDLNDPKYEKIEDDDLFIKTLLYTSVTISATNALTNSGTVEEKIETLPKREEENVAPLDEATKIYTGEIIKGLSAEEILAQGTKNFVTLSEDSENYRRVIEKAMEMQEENWSKAEAWMKANLPLVPLHRLKELIRTTDGGWAYGVFSKAAMYVYEHAEIGTTYHEAFEAVWSMFTTQTERTAMLKEFRNRQGDFFDRESQNDVAYKQATNGQIKEALAEELRDYVLNKKFPIKQNGVSRILKFFADFVSFVKNFVMNTGKVEGFFKKIDGGYYATKPVNIRNISENSPAYRRKIPVFNEAVHREILEGMSSRLIANLFKTNQSLVTLEEDGVSIKELYDAVYQEFANTYLANGPIYNIITEKITKDPNNKASYIAEYQTYLNTWENIKTNWDVLIKNNNDFLKTLGLVNETITDEVESNVEENINNEEKQGRSDDYLKDVMRIDSRKNAASSIKLLFATLIEVEENKKSNVVKINPSNGETIKMPKPSVSSIYQWKMVNYAKAFNHIMHNISNTSSLEKMMKKLSILSQDYPKYVRLFKRLKGDANTNQIDYNKLDVNDWKLLMKFFNVFAKQKPRSYIQFQDEAGNTYTQNANSGDAISATVNKWVSGLRTLVDTEANSAIKYNSKDKTYDVDKDVINNLSISTIADKIKLLKVLGISFTELEYGALSEAERKRFDNAISSIKLILSKDNKIATVKGRTLGIIGPLNILGEMKVKSTGDMSESTFYNSNGERVQTFVQNNYPSLFLSDFNSVENIEELFMMFPQLTDVWSVDSEILKKGGLYFTKEGERTQLPLELGYIDGTIKAGKKGKQTSKLSLAERRLQEFNQNTYGRYFTLVPADSKTEWMMSVGNFVSYEEMKQGNAWVKTQNKMVSFLSTEIKLALKGDRNSILNMEGRGNQLRFFKEILSSEIVEKINKFIKTSPSEEDVDVFMKEDVFRKAAEEEIKNYIQGETKKTLDYFSTYNVIKEEGDKYYFNGLDSEFRNNNDLGHGLIEKEIGDIVDMRTINYMMANIEMHKILFGDPALIKDTLKRIKSFLSGTETMYAGKEFDNYANKEYNQVDGISLQNGDAGYHKYKEYFKTITIKDIISTGELYSDVNEADAQTWMKDTSYREFLQKHGRWTPEQEEQFQYEMAWTRSQYEYENPLLEEHDKALLEKGDPEIATFPILKPKGSGMKATQEFIDLYLDKTSAAPLFMRHVQGANLEKMYEKMHEGDVDYLIVESGRKIGTETRHNIYNADGSFNETPFAENEIVDIPHRNIGIQQETEGDSHSQTLGSQLTKLATMDLMENGVPKGFVEDWDALSEEEKLKHTIYAEIKHNQYLLESLAKNGYEILLNKLGIIDKNGSYSTKDKKKLYKFLSSEMLKREMDENSKEGIELNFDASDFNIPLEASPKYIQIKNILLSIVDKNIGSPKVSGLSHIQMSSTMWESGKREVEKGKLLVSKELHFPTKEDPYMEIYLPAWFSRQLKNAGFRGDDKALVKQLTNTGILNGIGFRIPTQKLSSIDLIRVKGFLPHAMGNTVVVPAELTKKSGSDFDVDKLNTYLKNIRIDSGGKISLIEYKGTEEATREFYGKEFDENLANKTKNTKEFFNALQVALGNSDDEKLLARYQKLLNDVLTDGTEAETIKRLEGYANEELQKDLKASYIDRMYKLSLENAYFSSLEKLLSHPDNFDRLTKPNNGGENLKKLRDVLKEISTPKKEYTILNKKDNFSLLLSPNYMSEARHNFIIGKGGVGIAAVAQTTHAQSQRTKIYVNSDLAKDIPFAGDGEIKLPHNTISIEGRKYASLSGIMNKAKQYISDVVSEFIDGYVDISKDAFIVEIGATPNKASVFLFLVKLGVPLDDVVFFMNQPIIQEFSKKLEQAGYTGLLNDKIALATEAMFPSGEYSLLSGEEQLNVENFQDNIKKYYKERKEFTQAENIEQKQILHEFQKYALMASHLFEVTQGSNYDTANFNDSNIYTLKEQQTQNARENNIISSVDDLINKSFVKARMEYLSKGIKALAEAANLSIEKPFIKQILDPIKRFFAQKGVYLSEKDKLKAAREVEMSFLDYVIQTTLPLNTHIQDLMINEKKAVAYQLDELKNNLSLKEYSTLINNPILQELIPSPRDKKGGVKNIFLDHKDNDAHTSNIYTGALRELRDNALTNKLYKNIIALSLLQSGVRKTFYSFGHLIPVEDYSEIIAPLIRNLGTQQELENFRKNNAFFRNNFNNKDVVPVVNLRWNAKDLFNPYTGEMSGYMDEYGNYEEEYYSWAYQNVPLALKNLAPTSGSNTNFITIAQPYNSTAVKFPVIRVEKANINPKTNLAYTPSERFHMAKAGDFSFRDSMLYAQVLDENEQPVTHTVYIKKVPTTHFIYKQINAWGDGQFAQEYYSAPRIVRMSDGTTKISTTSKYENGMMKTDREFSDKEIIAALGDAKDVKDKSFQDFKKDLNTKDC